MRNVCLTLLAAAALLFSIPLGASAEEEMDGDAGYFISGTNVQICWLNEMDCREFVDIDLDTDNHACSITDLGRKLAETIPEMARGNVRIQGLEAVKAALLREKTDKIWATFIDCNPDDDQNIGLLVIDLEAGSESDEGGFVIEAVGYLKQTPQD